ncbi:hypothetical protein HL653_02675 [Sphingomonas sp. AP4-R1]|uniref:hypothetical protein n=1 Tax=Sphingomonas sp. AP4-R1 TaxID=2735134 RepID=UPI00149344D5|nr:hypothetical protein [Sphingomonas sp. AP4-R1]QJU56838.1 hypothetical protein HL653_02675 [Sphingomonas sp. AP4-R1]
MRKQIGALDPFSIVSGKSRYPDGSRDARPHLRFHEYDAIKIGKSGSASEEISAKSIISSHRARLLISRLTTRGKSIDAAWFDVPDGRNVSCWVRWFGKSGPDNSTAARGDDTHAPTDQNTDFAGSGTG